MVDKPQKHLPATLHPLSKREFLQRIAFALHLQRQFFPILLHVAFRLHMERQLSWVACLLVFPTDFELASLNNHMVQFLILKKSLSLYNTSQ